MYVLNSFDCGLKFMSKLNVKTTILNEIEIFQRLITVKSQQSAKATKQYCRDPALIQTLKNFNRRRFVVLTSCAFFQSYLH